MTSKKRQISLASVTAILFLAFSVDTALATGKGILINNNPGNQTVHGTTGITNTANTAAELTNNSGNIDLGTLNITNTASNQPGLVATNNTGTITTDAGTINTGGGTAVNIDGPGGLTPLDVSLTSVSSNGAAVGIVIQDTSDPGAGGFTITGTGTTDGSGGTIQNTVENGIRIVNATGISLSNIDLTNAATQDGGGGCSASVFTGCTAPLEMQNAVNVFVNNMTLNGSAEHGIFGQNVTNFDLMNSEVLNAGQTTDENGIFIVGLFGTTAAGTDNVFDAVTVDNAADNGIQIDNSAATTAGNTASPDLLTVRNAGMIQNSGVSGILATTASNANLRLDVLNSFFTNNSATGIATNANGGILQTNISGNSLVPGAGQQFRGVAGGATGSGQLFFNITDNTITQRGSAGTGPAAIAYAAFDTATINGTIGGTGAANTISSVETGSPVLGISVTNEGSGASAVRIDNNGITVPDGFGIIANAQGSGAGLFSVTITNNNISVTGTDVANTAVSAANSGTAGQTLCLNTEDNILSTAPAGNGDTVIANSASGTYRVQGLMATVNEAADFLPDTQTVEILITGRQTSSPGGTFINPFSGSTTFNPATCGLPATP